MGVKASRIVMAIVVLTMLPAVVMTVSIVRQSIFDNNVRKFIKTELTQRGTQVISSDVEKDSLRLRVVAVGREITEPTRLAAERRMEQYGMEGYSLRIIQGVQTDSILALNNQLSQISTTREADHRKLLELSAQTTTLTTQLNSYIRLDKLSAEIRPEISTLFPQVNTLALARAAEAVGDTVHQRHFVIALVGVGTNKSLTPVDRLKLQQWLQIRVDEDSLVLIEK